MDFLFEANYCVWEGVLVWVFGDYVLYCDLRLVINSLKFCLEFLFVCQVVYIFYLYEKVDILRVQDYIVEFQGECLYLLLS